MARYLVIHTAPEDVTQDEVISCARQVVAYLPHGVQWLNSWVAGESQQVFCEWEAEDEEALSAGLEPVKGLFPVQALHLVTWIDPAWYQ